MPCLSTQCVRAGNPNGPVDGRTAAVCVCHNVLVFSFYWEKKNTPRDFIVKTQEYEREFWLSDNINSQKAILPDKNMWRNFKDIYSYISTDYDTGNDGVPFADLLPEERINAAAYYVEEHLEDWTTLLSFTVPYARYTDVPNAK